MRNDQAWCQKGGERVMFSYMQFVKGINQLTSSRCTALIMGSKIKSLVTIEEQYLILEHFSPTNHPSLQVLEEFSGLFAVG